MRISFNTALKKMVSKSLFSVFYDAFERHKIWLHLISMALSFASNCDFVTTAPLDLQHFHPAVMNVKKTRTLNFIAENNESNKPKGTMQYRLQTGVKPRQKSVKN